MAKVFDRRDRMYTSPLAASHSLGAALCRTLLPVEAATDDNDTEPAAAAAAQVSASGWLNRIAVRSLNRIIIVPVRDIVRIAAEDNYVRIFAERPYLHREALSALSGRLDPAHFLRVHRSHLINMERVRDFAPLLHGEYRIGMDDGSVVTSARRYRETIQAAFGLCAGGARG